MKYSRRAFVKLSGAALIAGALTLALPFKDAAYAASQDELMEKTQLSDMVLGDENAPITMIEYSSLTCSHCAYYKTNIYPKIKENYIDTGKVRYIYRELPLDMVAAAASMIGRSLPEDRYDAYLGVMAEKQKDWAFTDNPYQSLLKMAQQMGMTEAQFKEAVSNQELLNGLNEKREKAMEFGVNSTPTFFVNGEMVKGALPYEEFEAIFEKDLK
ncbi:DsbA family protein [Rhodobacteraceae bacterium RKSG542]|uniref:DsbA family protein n=1 Tax=Pseudovibrio flavus TaxID=2529854 RepID=UPI0012BC0D2D|nr:DsbA family protein [Pseudovibrio flavus]MTI18677.1 DsbA family protein [Pseudovibrio flavus]